MLKENTTRNQWPLSKVTEMNPDDQWMVRSVTLLLCIDNNSNCERILEHPISTLVLILEAVNIDSMTKGAWRGFLPFWLW